MKYNIIIYYFLVLAFVFLSSCNLKTPNERAMIDNLGENHVNLKIQKSVGELFEEGDHFLPLPVNIGVVKSLEKRAILISKKVAHGKSVSSKVIGKIVFKTDTMSDILVCFPLDLELKVLKAENYTDFSTIDFQAKHIIESYFRGYKGIANDDFHHWEPVN